MRAATPRWHLGILPVLIVTALAVPAATRAEGVAAKVEPLDWLAGSWSGSKGGVVSEEHWTSSAGGALIGLHKDVKGDRMTSFEFLRIELDAERRVCYVASPRGGAPTSFCATELGARRVVFENRAHDFPQRIHYWLDAEGRLHARVEGSVDGREVGEEWVWSRGAP